MKIKLLCALFISTFSSTVGFAQIDSRPNSNLEFSLGYNSGSLKNLEIAPVSRYDYEGLVYKLNYERTTENENLFNIQLAYLQSELASDVIPVLNLDYSKIELRVAYLKEMYNNNRFTTYVGLQSTSDVSLYTNNTWNRTIIDQSLGIASQFLYQINNKHALFSKLAIPVVLFRVTDSDTRVYSFNRHQSVLWNIGYKHTLSNRLDLKFAYDFNYDRLQIRNAFREVQYQFNIGLNFKF